MCNFALMNRPWQYRSENFDEKDFGYYLKHGEVTHKITVSVEGEMTSHEIGSEVVIRDGDKEVVYENGISFYPAEFIGTKLPGVFLNTKVEVLDSVYLVYESNNVNYHLAQSMLSKSKKMTDLHKNLVYFWYHGETIIALIFKDKEFYMGNSFRALNQAEVVYFVTAMMQDAKFDTVSYFLVGDIAESKADQLGSEFERLGIHMEFINSKLPYISRTEIPDQHIATNLLMISTCGLPEEF